MKSTTAHDARSLLGMGTHPRIRMKRLNHSVSRFAPSSIECLRDTRRLLIDNSGFFYYSSFVVLAVFWQCPRFSHRLQARCMGDPSRATYGCIVGPIGMFATGWKVIDATVTHLDCAIRPNGWARAIRRTGRRPSNRRNWLARSDTLIAEQLSRRMIRLGVPMHNSGCHRC